MRLPAELALQLPPRPRLERLGAEVGSELIPGLGVRVVDDRTRRFARVLSRRHHVDCDGQCRSPEALSRSRAASRRSGRWRCDRSDRAASGSCSRWCSSRGDGRYWCAGCACAPKRPGCRWYGYSNGVAICTFESRPLRRVVASGYVMSLHDVVVLYVGAMVQPCPRERGLMLRPAVFMRLLDEYYPAWPNPAFSTFGSAADRTTTRTAGGP